MMYFPLKTLFDEILVQFTLSEPPISPKKILFWGERAGEISSYVAGWLAGKGIDIIVLDGANRFDPYMVSSFAKKALIPPEGLLKRIRIARAFTCYQMATLMGERLVSLFSARAVGAIHACTPKCGVSARRHESPLQKPWVILLGPVTPFLDEDVPEREVRPLFERSLRKIEEMATEGTPFLLFQPNSPFAKGGMGGLKDSKRMYLMKRLFQFSDLVWRICLDDQGTKMILEKGIEMVSHCERSEAISRDCFVAPRLRDSSQ